MVLRKSLFDDLEIKVKCSSLKKGDGSSFWLWCIMEGCTLTDMDRFETENSLGGIVEARDEHKNFLTKYHQSFFSNIV